jgi:putative peptidoglycan lipid II flippase
MVGLILLGSSGIALLLERGNWTAEDTAATAWALAFFAIGIAGHSLLEVLSRAFFALSDTRTPVLIGIASMVSNVLLSLVFVQFIGSPTSLSRGSFGGLALANSLTTLLEGLALWWLLRRRIGNLNDGTILNGAIRSLGAAFGMGVAIWGITQVVRGALLTTIVGGVVGLAVFFGLAFVLGIEEARSVPRSILRRR